MGAYTHLGLRMNDGRKYGNRLSRDTYAQINKHNSLKIPQTPENEAIRAAQNGQFEDEAHTTYTDEWCIQHLDDALRNFDLNMRYFTTLDVDEFQAAVETLSELVPGLKAVEDLHEYDDFGGLYVMVLDEYKQVYIGVTFGSLPKRIREHWTGSKPFDRLIFGLPTTSVLSIDSFRALDTTRVFAARSEEPYTLERELVAEFPAKFVLNRMDGGRFEGKFSFLTTFPFDRMRDLEPTSPSETSSQPASSAIRSTH